MVHHNHSSDSHVHHVLVGDRFPDAPGLQQQEACHDTCDVLDTPADARLRATLTQWPLGARLARRRSVAGRDVGDRQEQHGVQAAQHAPRTLLCKQALRLFRHRQQQRLVRRGGRLPKYVHFRQGTVRAFPLRDFRINVSGEAVAAIAHADARLRPLPSRSHLGNKDVVVR